MVEINPNQIKNNNNYYNMLCSIHIDKFIEDLFQEQPHSPFHTFRTFQKAVTRIANEMVHTMVAAPSQSGKSTATLAHILPVLFKPDGFGMVITNKDDNAKKMYDDFVKYVLGDEELQKDLHRHTQKVTLRRGIGISAITKLAAKKNGEFIMTTPLGARVMFSTATESAVAGKSPDRLTLDEVAVWPTNLARRIYAEALARIGQTHGQILSASTVRDDGNVILLPDGTHDLEGNLFFSQLCRIWHKQNSVEPGTKLHEAALIYTLHASERLQKYVFEMGAGGMTRQALKYHYYSIPMADPESLMFAHAFKPADHQFDKKDIHQLVPVSSTSLYVASFDPGKTGAAVLMRIVTAPNGSPQVRVFVLKEWRTNLNETSFNFARRVFTDIETQHPEVFISNNFMLTGDVASSHRKGNHDSYKEEIEQATGVYMFTRGQGIGEGCDLILMYLETPHAFFIDHSCKNIINGFKKGVKMQKDPQTGAMINAYVKDGLYDHFFDAMRYGIHNGTRRLPPVEYRKSWGNNHHKRRRPLTQIRSAY